MICSPPPPHIQKKERSAAPRCLAAGASGWKVVGIEVSSYAWQMAATLILTATVMAGLAMIASPLMVSTKGLLPGLLAALALGITAAVLITIARGIT